MRGRLYEQRIEGSALNEFIRNRQPNATQHARRLRKESGASEQRLWGFLRNGQLGFRFRRQYPVGRFILDFYCPAAKLCVEVDGEIHLARVDRDKARDDALAALGILTVRVPSLLLYEGKGEDVTAFFERLISLCEERVGRKADPGGS
jgi:very-short-patch-repair endonuclease